MRDFLPSTLTLFRATSLPKRFPVMSVSVFEWRSARYSSCRHPQLLQSPRRRSIVVVFLVFPQSQTQCQRGELPSLGSSEITVNLPKRWPVRSSFLGGTMAQLLLETCDSKSLYPKGQRLALEVTFKDISIHAPRRDDIGIV